MKIDNITPPLSFHHPRQLSYIFTLYRYHHLHMYYELQDRDCTYDVILRRFNATTVAVKEQEILHILSVCL